jgi:hypothetical protein
MAFVCVAFKRKKKKKKKKNLTCAFSFPAVLDMGTDAEQATGLEKRELDALAKGETLFGEDILYGAFGTPEKPVIVRSVFDSRIVGCVGHAGHEHDLIWHVVSNGKPLVCLECGQVFKLEKIDDPLLHSHH